MHAKDKVRLLLSARTPVHEVLSDDLTEKLGGTAPTEISIDRLQEHEVTELSRLLDEYGLWGKSASFHDDRKAEILQYGECKGEFSRILVKLLDSPQMSERLSLILKDLASNEPQRDFVIITLALSVLSFRLKGQMLADLFGREVNNASFRRSPSVRELIDFSTGEVTFRSSAIARHILQHDLKPDVAIDILARIAAEADRSADASRTYRDLLTKLTRFSEIQELLPQAGRRPSVIRYYESLKNLRHTRREPLFWLQYAMACLSFNEIERAERYFKTAYSFAEKRGHGYNTFQIDNHYARFLLTKAIGQAGRIDPQTVMSVFREADALVRKQTTTEVRHYPFRVASLYKKFWDTYHDEVPQEGTNQMLRSAEIILHRIERLPTALKAHYHVRACREALQGMLSMES